MFCYTLMGGALALVIIAYTINEPVKRITDYQLVQGKIQQSKHTNIKGERTRFKLSGIPDWFHLHLDRDQRHLFSKGSDVKVWFHKTLAGTHVVKQVSVNGKILWHYNYERQIRLQYKSLALSMALIAGLLYMYRRVLLKWLRLKT
jgi:hypothetical protein